MMPTICRVGVARETLGLEFTINDGPQPADGLVLNEPTIRDVVHSESEFDDVNRS